MGNLFAPCAVVCREDQNPHRLPCKLIPRLLERCKAGERADFAVAPGLFELVCTSGFVNTASIVSQGRAIGGNATDRAFLDYLLAVQPQPPSCSKE